MEVPVTVNSMPGVVAMCLEIQFVPTMNVVTGQPTLVPQGICLATFPEVDAETKEAIPGKFTSKWLIRPIDDLQPLVAWQQGPVPAVEGESEIRLEDGESIPAPEDAAEIAAILEEGVPVADGEDVSAN